MSYHFFLPIPILSPNNHPHSLDLKWIGKEDRFAFFVNSNQPPASGPDFLIGTKLGVGFSTSVDPAKLADLTIKGNATIGYAPEEIEPNSLPTNGLKVFGKIRSDKMVDAPHGDFDTATLKTATIGKASFGTVTTPFATLQSDAIVLGAAGNTTSVQIQSGAPSFWKTKDKLELEGNQVVIGSKDHRTYVKVGKKIDDEKGIELKTINGTIDLRTVHDATMLGHSTAIHLRADKGRINIDGPTYIESTKKNDNPTRLQVTDGPIVQVQSVGDNKDPTKLDGKHIVIGNGIKGDIDYLQMTEHYGMRMVWQDSVAGFQLQDITKPEQPTTRDTVMFWGDDVQNRFRIRFVGNVPSYVDHQAPITTTRRVKVPGKRGKPAKWKTVKVTGELKDLSAEDLNLKGFSGFQGMPQKNVAFDEEQARKFRDIVVIEPDGSFKVNGSVYAYQHRKWSDSRLKESIKPIRKALDKVNAMRGVSYRWRLGEIEDMPRNDRRQLGLLAQEIEKVCPEVVTTEKVNDRPTKTVDYTQIVPVLIEAIKEQQATITELQTRLVTLEKRVGAAQVPSANPRLKKRSSKRYDA